SHRLGQKSLPERTVGVLKTNACPGGDVRELHLGNLNPFGDFRGQCRTDHGGRRHRYFSRITAGASNERGRYVGAVPREVEVSESEKSHVRNILGSKPAHEPDAPARVPR